MTDIDRMASEFLAESRRLSRKSLALKKDVDALLEKLGGSK